jgi:hypothetical protein
MAFVRATTAISGRDAVEEFLISKIWPLGTEAPMSKVLIPLPNFVIVKPDNEGGEEFVTKVAARANMLVGCYDWNEHQACLAQILTARFNCVFEVAGIKY